MEEDRGTAAGVHHFRGARESAVRRARGERVRGVDHVAAAAPASPSTAAAAAATASAAAASRPARRWRRGTAAGGHRVARPATAAAAVPLGGDKDQLGADLRRRRYVRAGAQRRRGCFHAARGTGRSANRVDQVRAVLRPTQAVHGAVDVCHAKIGVRGDRVDDHVDAARRTRRRRGRRRGPTASPAASPVPPGNGCRSPGAREKRDARAVG